MIQRKFTPCYVEFVRGKYRYKSLSYLIMLIQGLSFNERRSLFLKDFNQLWDGLWSMNTDKKRDRLFYDAKEQFDRLMTGYQTDQGFMSLESLLDAHPVSYNEPEWGFPKGRREDQERDIECAVREFTEETGIPPEKYNIVDRARPYIEEFNGTDDNPYRHVYYLCQTKEYFPVWLDGNNPQVCAEIRKIGWFSLEECLNMIRPYHNAKKQVIQKIYDDVTTLAHQKK